jgi:hypothetical protein
VQRDTARDLKIADLPRGGRFFEKKPPQKASMSKAVLYRKKAKTKGFAKDPLLKV